MRARRGHKWGAENLHLHLLMWGLRRNYPAIAGNCCHARPWCDQPLTHVPQPWWGCPKSRVQRGHASNVLRTPGHNTTRAIYRMRRTSEREKVLRERPHVTLGGREWAGDGARLAGKFGKHPPLVPGKAKRPRHSHVTPAVGPPRKFALPRLPRDIGCRHSRRDCPVSRTPQE